MVMSDAEVGNLMFRRRPQPWCLRLTEHWPWTCMLHSTICPIANESYMGQFLTTMCIGQWCLAHPEAWLLASRLPAGAAVQMYSQ